jgi:hypothetical protein
MIGSGMLLTTRTPEAQKPPEGIRRLLSFVSLRGKDLNLRPSGYEAVLFRCCNLAINTLQCLQMSNSVSPRHSCGTASVPWSEKMRRALRATDAKPRTGSLSVAPSPVLLWTRSRVVRQRRYGTQVFVYCPQVKVGLFAEYRPRHDLEQHAGWIKRVVPRP